MPPVFPLSSLCGFQSIDLARMPFLCISLAEPNLFLIHQLKNHLQEIELITQETHHFTSTFKFLEFLVRDMMSITESDRQMTLCVCVRAGSFKREQRHTRLHTSVLTCSVCLAYRSTPDTAEQVHSQPWMLSQVNCHLPWGSMRASWDSAWAGWPIALFPGGRMLWL